MTKSITFRPTEKELKKINETIKEKKFKKKSEAIRHLILREAPSQPQLEHSEGDFFQYPPFLFCPNSNTWITKETLLISREGCKNCKSKKSCPAWRLKELF